MTAADDLGREMERDAAATEAKMLEAVRELALIAEAMRPLTARQTELRDQVKQFMTLNGLDELADRETGVVAKIQDRNSTPTYDLVSAVERGHDQALVHAASAGMLRLDHTMLQRFRKANGAWWAETIARYEMPGTSTTALIVEKRSQ